MQRNGYRDSERRKSLKKHLDSAFQVHFRGLCFLKGLVAPFWLYLFCTCLAGLQISSRVLRLSIAEELPGNQLP